MEKVIEIPKQLREPEFRFLLLGKKAKEPIEEKWQNENNYKFYNLKLQEHIKKGNNYGIIGGFGNLILIDGDNEEVSKLCEEKLPKTFTIKTGGLEEYRKHYYFIANKQIKPIRLNKEKIGDMGDIRSVGQYVVSPNSIHPSGNKYEIIKDIPISKITEERVREVFKEFIDQTKSTEFKEFLIDTTKRSSEFIRKCLIPDYCLNNKLKGNTSKNWELFPYLVDILWNRESDISLYKKLIEKQEHKSGAIKGWIKKAQEGQLMKTSCKKMQNHLKNFHPELIEVVCRKCKLFEREIEEKGLIISNEVKKVIHQYYGKRDLAEKILERQPIYYDKNKMWWVWDDKDKKWKMVDDTDILNFVRELSFANTVKTKERTEILEAIKQEARLRKPNQIKKTWVQFKDIIIDIENGEEFKASPEYFVTNPIPYQLHKERFIETPVMNRIFEEWVGKNHVKTLYEIIAYCLLPDYPIHRLFCIIGEGLNGKSCFLRLLKKFVGEENVTSTELDILLSSRFEITRLHKKLVCLMGETNFSEINKTSIIKKLTGQDLIGFEYKNKNPFEDKNYSKIIIATNNLPTTTDKTIGFYRRWCIIDFPNKFSEKRNILDDIPEEEYEILAVKSLIILKDLLEKREFYNEGTIEQRAKKYEDHSDPLEKFMKEFTEEDLESHIWKFEFEKRFNEWCKENRFRQMSEVVIGKKMRDKGIEQVQEYSDWLIDGENKRLRAWLGLKWKESEQVAQEEQVNPI